MSAISLLQLITDCLFVVIFVFVAIKALRRRWRANVDIALLFAVPAAIIVEGLALPVLHVIPRWILNAVTASLLMALPYLLLRLVDDFTVVRRSVMVTAAVGLAVSVIILFLVPSPLPVWLTMLYVLYFVALTGYVALTFVRAARQSNGVTRRRMQAVAWGVVALALTIIFDGCSAAFPALVNLWMALAQLTALACGIAFFIGFAPPSWLRRTWQEPELRAFLSSAARLPRLPDTGAIVHELERTAAALLGTVGASIGLWVPEQRVLRFVYDGRSFEWASDQLIAGRAFTTQKAIFSADTLHDDPANQDVHLAYRSRVLMAVPISAGEQRLGVLVAFAERAPIFADDDLALAQMLADQAAVILESRALIDEAARVRAHDEATRLKDDFLSAAAHDLKTPLTALTVQAQLLERRALRDPEAPADLAGIQRMVSETQRLRRFVTELLDASRLERGQLVGLRERVELASLAEEACARYTAGQHCCYAAAAGPIVGRYDAGRIMQLLDNLLENAVKYSPQGGEIAVEIWRVGNEAHLTVSDHGIGIPPDDLPHLFDRFHRASNVDDRRFAGMGLGLYICRGIVEQHGGRIWATSPGSGHGSTIHVVLPVVNDNAEASVLPGGDSPITTTVGGE